MRWLPLNSMTTVPLAGLQFREVLPLDAKYKELLIHNWRLECCNEKHRQEVQGVHDQLKHERKPSDQACKGLNTKHHYAMARFGELR